MRYFAFFLISKAPIVLFFITYANSDTIYEYQYTVDHSFGSARYGALGGAGCALVDDVGSAFTNPSLLNAWNRKLNSSRFSFFAGYGTDTLFSAVLPVGVSWFIEGVGSTAAILRYVRNSNTTYSQQAAFLFSTRLFEKKMNMGAVDFGISLKAENTSWTLNAFAPVISKKYLYRPDSTYVISSDSADNEKIKQKRILFDLGFYQSNFAQKVDLGITLHQVFGKTWRQIRPSLKNTRRFLIDSIYIYNPTTMVQKDTLGYIDSVWYENEYATEYFWLDPRDCSLRLGIAIHHYLRQLDTELIIAADLEILGLLTIEHTILRFGVEASVYENYFLRAGFCREPKLFAPGTDGSFKNETRFSMGAGAVFFPIYFNAYLGRGGIGVETTIRM